MTDPKEIAKLLRQTLPYVRGFGHCSLILKIEEAIKELENVTNYAS